MKQLLFLSLLFYNLSAMHDGNVGSPTHSGKKRKPTLYEVAERRLKTKKCLDLPLADSSYTPLSYFSAIGDTNMVNRLLQAGADPSAEALDNAVSSNHLECIRLLLRFKADPNLINPKILLNYWSNTPLHLICDKINDNDKFRVEILQLLLSHGAHPNAQNVFKQTPLYNLLQPIFLFQKKEKIPIYAQRKQLIHELIFHGAQLQDDQTKEFPFVLVKNSKDPDLIDLARYAERRYYWHKLLLCRKKGGWFFILPKELLKFIADRVV